MALLNIFHGLKSHINAKQKIQLAKKNALDSKIKNRIPYSSLSTPIKRTTPYEIIDIKKAEQNTQAYAGYNRQPLLDIYDYILNDAHLSSQINTATIKVLSTPFALFKNNTLDESITELFKAQWIEELIYHILDAEFYGYSLIEFTPNALEQLTVDNITLINRYNYQIETQTLLLEGHINGKKAPLIGNLSDYNLIQIGTKTDLGILKIAAYCIIQKTCNQSDWLRLNEKWGIPNLHIETTATSPAELSAIENNARNFGGEAFIITQEGDKVQVLQGTNHAEAHATFFDNIKYQDEQISKIINGQTSTADQKSFVGSAGVHERILEDYTHARLRTVQNILNNQIIPYMIEKNILTDKYQFKYQLQPEANPVKK